MLYAGTETCIYISFDDGANWQRAGGNLPVSPIHDLVVKDYDLVVATHGRSFWILDDLSPLRQAPVEASPQLFAPAPKVRLRTYSGFGGWDENYGSDMVNYGGVGTSVAAFTGGANSERPHFLNAGHNPPAGIVFVYALAEQPDAPLELNIRSVDGELIRRYSSESGDLSAEAGINRFHWNMRYAGSVAVDGVAGWWERPDGPMVVPGEYEAELVAGGARSVQRFSVLADPRVETSDADYQAQLEMLLDIRDRLSQNNELINKLVALKRQVGAWAGRSDDAALKAQAAAIAAEVDRLLPELINVGYTESQLYASGLHEKFNALIDSVDSADYAPPQHARQVFAQLCDELDGHAAYLRTDLSETVSDFNAAVRELGLEAVDLP